MAALPFFARAEESPRVPGYPPEIWEVEIPSTIDDHVQVALFYAPDRDDPVPLLIALHTWSGDFRQAGGEVNYARWCLAEDWAFIHPNFRGPNNTVEACGSDKVITDIFDALSYAQMHGAIHPERIYVVGVSGGGHAALLLAARAPDLWAGVSAWCGISDLQAWHEQCTASGRSKYVQHMESACGGPPTTALQQYKERSPITWLSHAKGSVHLDINHGIHDGVAGSVPFSQSLLAFNEVAAEPDRIPPTLIEQLEAARAPLPSLPELEDPVYHEEPLILRRVSGRCRVTVFEGGHEIIHHAALNWLKQQRKSEPPVWELDPEEISSPLAKSGRADSGK